MKKLDSQISELRKKQNGIMGDFLSLLPFQEGDKVKDKDGNIFGNPIDAERFCEFDNMMRLLGDCEDIFAPPSYVPLKKRWAQLVNDTWHKFIMIFKPYFCK